MGDLTGKTIAVMTSQDGVEKAELVSPLQAIKNAGGRAVHLAPEAGEVQSMVGDVDKDEVFSADGAIVDADPADFDILVIPGGTVNADKLRADEAGVAFVRAFVEAGKPVASICHGPWSLVEAGVVKGKTLTSYPSLQTDIRNAGGSWVDEEVHVDTAQGWTLITSRNPGDLDAFNEALTDLGDAAGA
ncbi:MAG: type 1 glutamine amidotransferase domain-containing protein [Mycobacteriales bacterium]